MFEQLREECFKVNYLLPKLELVLYRLSSTPLKGILLRTGVTAAIQ